MSTRKQYRKSLPPPPMYVILSEEGQIYTGLKGGDVQWSYNWNEAKPLFIESTSWILREYAKTELIDINELI